MKVGFIPWQHQCDGSAGRRLNVPVVSNSPEDAAKQFSFLASIPSVRQSHIQQVDPRTPGMAPTQPGLISDLDQPGYFKTRKL
jgi:hypothetical protein